MALGIDCSTTSCKVIAFNQTGHLLAIGRSPIAILTSPDNGHEQDAESWWQALVDATRQVTAQIDVHRLVGVSLACQRETFVLTDGDGRPLGNALLWMDERGRDQLGWIEKQIGGEAFHRTTGKPLSGNLTAPKLAWLAENYPDRMHNAARILDVHGFLIHRLIGSPCTSWGCADPTGLFDMQQQRWSPEIVVACGARMDQLPPAIAPGAWVGEVTASAAELCGLPEGLPVYAGLGDGQAGGLSINLSHTESAYLNLGTAVIGGFYSPTYVISRAFRTMFGGYPTGYFLETVILGGAYTLDWFIKQFCGPADQGETEIQSQSVNQTQTSQPIPFRLEQMAQELPPGAEGLLLVPYWNSAMNPYWDPAARGIIIGWQGRHGKAHMYRAILEGIAFELRLHLEGVAQALGQQIAQFIAMGGGTHSSMWLQVIADVTGIPIRVCDTPEAAALGAGILAASGSGMFPDVFQAAEAMTPRLSSTYLPEPARHKHYVHLYETVYRHLYPALREYLGN